MISSLAPIRCVFSVAVALAAATAGDALVEGLSNSRLWWHGRFTDGSSADLLPVSSLAMLALLATLGLLVVRSLRGHRGSVRAFALETSRALSFASVARLLPAIYALAVALLFTMETTEQYVVYGHVLGGTLWLGGPPLVSLAIHAVIATVAASAAALSLRTFAGAFVIVARAFRAHALRRGSGRVRARRDHRIFFLAQRRSARLAERGPPARAISPIAR